MKKLVAPVMNPAFWSRLAVILLICQLAACATSDGGPDSRGWSRSGAAKTYDPAAVDSSQAKALLQAADLQERLDRVAGPLLVASHGLCRRHSRNLIGISARNKYSYAPQLAEPAERVFGLGERLQVMSVLPGSGADSAGVRRGDILLAAEGQAIPKGSHAESEVVALLAPLIAKRKSVRLTVRRDGDERSLTVPLTRACGFRVELGNSDNVNSYSDGNRVLVTRGMMQFARNDSELAYVVAKEMAHNVLNHASVLKTTPAAAGIIDKMVRGEATPDAASAALKPLPQQYDIAADMLSLHMAARAGHEIDPAPTFWRRLAEQYPAGPPDVHTTQHPASAARLAAMTRAIPKVKATEEKRKAAGAR